MVTHGALKPAGGSLLGLLALVFCLTPGAAWAQDEAASPQGDVIELAPLNVLGRSLYSDQVNALRTPTPVLDVPQSLSIITAEQIAEHGFTNIADIINYTPGVNTTQGEGHRDAVVFRGVRSTADFFIDGVRDDVQYYRPLYNLAQVEILRGPNALFFGRGGTGGVINRVTKKPIFRENFTGYQTSVDTFGEYSVQLDSNAALGDKSAVRINAFYESLSNHRDFFEGERIGVNPTVRFALGEMTTVDLSYEYMDHERFIDRGIPTGSNGRPVEAFKDIVFGDPELNLDDLEANLFRASVQHTFSDYLKANFTAFFGDYDKLYQNFYTSGYNQAATPDRVTLDGYVDTTQRENLILSGNLIGEFKTAEIKHTLIAGIEYIDTTSNQDRFNTFWNTTSDDNEVFLIERPLNLRQGVGVNASGQNTVNDFTADLNDDTHVTVDVFSLYLQDEIALSRHFDVILGLRFDRFAIDVLDLAATDPARANLSRVDEVISPRAGMVYKPREEISFYWSYSESFLPRSGEQFSDLGSGRDDLEPDTFTNLEAGMKWNFDQRLSLTASVFKVEQSSPQARADDSARLVIIDSEVTGYEIQLQGQMTEDWTITAGYSKLDGEQVNASGPTGRRPIELPEQMFSLWNNYKVTEQFGLGLGIIYQAESFINTNNTAVLPRYTRVDAALFYQVTENLRLQINVENLTDELYFPHAHSTHEVTVGESINARFTIIGRF